MFTQKNRRSQAKSAGKQANGQAVGCVAEPLERRVLLSGSYELVTLPRFNKATGVGRVVGLVPTGSISGNVFNDRNADGIRELHDRELGGVTLTLQELSAGNPVGQTSTTTTDSSGHYSFTGLRAGTYRVTPTLPRGQSVTTPADGSYIIALATGQNSTDDNFGDFTFAYDFTRLHDPKAGKFGSTLANGVSGNTVVGCYVNYETSGSSGGFIYNDLTGVYTTLNDPNAVNGTYPSAVSGNIVVGYYEDAHWVAHGFIYNGRTFTRFDDPDAGTTGQGPGTYANGVYGNTIVGEYSNNTGGHNYIYNDINGTFTTLNDPNSGFGDGAGTSTDGISGNTIVGSYATSSGVNHGFVYNENTGVFTTLDDPTGGTSDTDGTGVSGISGNTIIGTWHNANVTAGYIYDENTALFTALNAGDNSIPTGIFGDTIVGNFDGNHGNSNGFIFTPVGSISGNVFNDRHGKGIDETGDNGLADVTVTIQKLRNGHPFGHETITTTNAGGHYSFSGLAAGTYKVTEQLPPGQVLKTPVAGSYTIALSAGQNSSGNNFGDQKIIKPVA